MNYQKDIHKSVPTWILNGPNQVGDLPVIRGIEFPDWMLKNINNDYDGERQYTYEIDDRVKSIICNLTITNRNILNIEINEDVYFGGLINTEDTTNLNERQLFGVDKHAAFIIALKMVTKCPESLSFELKVVIRLLDSPSGEKIFQKIVKGSKFELVPNGIASIELINDKSYIRNFKITGLNLCEIK